ncbi:MAG: protein kinase, partial [Candidatus Brocadiaceae bacterium]
LVYAHSKDIIHRDLKPANIMLNEQGIVKIADFGVAGLLAEARAQKGGKRRVMGTRGYMPPEQEQHINRTDERSDIFALGAVIYRVLTGQVPDRLPPVAPSELDAEVDPRIDSLVLKCLEAAPDHRYGSAEELLEALEAYHREVTRAQEVCPNCKRENPVTQRTCLHCGADLSELFDVCPECGTENRIDVEICMGCGSSLKQLRHQISVRISKLEEQARVLASRHRYEEALTELKKVTEVKGKVFERARQKARRLIEEYRELREEYYHSRAEEAHEFTEKGRLDEALEIVESVPEEFVEKEELESLAINIKSRMALARKRVEGIEKMLEERQFDKAEDALAKAERTWVDCPGLAEARKKLESTRQTEEMVHYELAEAKEQMEEGNYARAREVLQFALSTSPDQPDVKRLLEEIDRREKKALLRRALSEGKAAYEEGDFRKAMRCWKNALGILPEDDPGREKLAEKVRTAQEKALGTQIVPLEPSPVVALQPARSGGAGLFGRSSLFGLLVFVGTAIALIGGFLVFLVLSG